MKKLIVLLLCACCLLSMSACVKDADPIIDTTASGYVDTGDDNGNGNPNYDEEQVPPDAR
jgi:hypothetical protein